MNKKSTTDIPIGTQALIFSKLYYGVLVKSLETFDIDRYFTVLYFLDKNNGCNQQYICNNLSVDKTAMVKVINYLIKANYIERRVNTNDKREHFIYLTKKGEKKTEEIVKAFNAIDFAMFSELSVKEQASFLKMLNKLSVKLQQLPANDLIFNYKLTKTTNK